MPEPDPIPMHLERPVIEISTLMYGNHYPVVITLLHQSQLSVVSCSVLQARLRLPRATYGRYRQKRGSLIILVVDAMDEDDPTIRHEGRVRGEDDAAQAARDLVAEVIEARVIASQDTT